MMRVKNIFTKKNNVDNINQSQGQIILCEDSGELFFDTPTNGRVAAGFSGHTKTYNIFLKKEAWTNNGIDYTQLPDYSSEIFRGKYYDENINVIVSLSQNNTEMINIIARASSDKTRLEFVSDILPTTDIMMDIMTV